MSALEERAFADYAAFAPRSAELAARAREVFPGGSTRGSAWYAPFPLYVDSADGSRLRDADGHTLVDFSNNYTALIHGHAHPDTVRAIADAARRGSLHGAATSSQVALATHLRDRLPSLERLRFCASGSEATLMAIRCARAATGRRKVVKMEGGYHGSHDLATVSLVPDERAGPLAAPLPVPADAGVAAGTLADCITCPYNEPELARAVLARHAGEVAAVIVEPVLGSAGIIPARPEFLAALREETARHGIVLIFDEVVTLRLGDLGAQRTLGIAPDLTALGKIIGGGLPIGAFGGRADLMSQFDPHHPSPLLHTSTFSGSPLAMAAGLAALDAFDPQRRERIDALGERLRSGIDAAFAAAGIRGRASGCGSLCQVHFTDAPVHDARAAVAAARAAGPVPRCLHLALLVRGIAASGRLMFCTSTAMANAEVDAACDALADALAALRDGIAAERPALLR